MKVFPSLLFGLLVCAIPLSAAGPAPAQPIAANDPRIRYEGRFDFSAPAGPVVGWAGSRISLDFGGSRLVLHWGQATGQDFFNVQVDGTTEVVGVPAGASGETVWPHPLDAGRHRLTLFKRSEAAAGEVCFAGVEIGSGQEIWAPAPTAYRLRMEFIGDSITAGACDEDGDKDQWADRGTHNFALSYATLTSSAFAADLRCAAVSGMGIATGWMDVKAGQVWDRVYPRVGAPRADLAAWQPAVAFVNLGENDDSFPHAHNQPFPAGYTAGYVALVQSIRAAYPHARLVLLRGGMFGGSQSAPLREAWTEAVRQLEAADPAISYFVFTHWSANHPRVGDHRAMADELIAWLKQQPFMRTFL